MRGNTTLVAPLSSGPLGVTPVEVELPAGAHKITLSYAGHRPHAATVQLRAGETTRLDVAAMTELLLELPFIQSLVRGEPAPSLE